MTGMLIETEATPNPATIKFLPGRVVMDAGAWHWPARQEAQAGGEIGEAEEERILEHSSFVRAGTSHV